MFPSQSESFEFVQSGSAPGFTATSVSSQSVAVIVKPSGAEFRQLTVTPAGRFDGKDDSVVGLSILPHRGAPYPSASLSS